MKHLFGRFYFKAPCFIGIRTNTRLGMVLGNLALLGIIIILIIALRG